jgi:hypothetical protein
MGEKVTQIALSYEKSNSDLIYDTPIMEPEYQVKTRKKFSLKVLGRIQD